MRKNLIAVISALFLIATMLTLVACGGNSTELSVPVATSTSLADHDTAPTFDGYYKDLYDLTIASSLSNEEKAAFLWAIASYSEGQAEHFVYFENKVGAAPGSGEMYYQQINKREPKTDGSGSKYHYTLKKVVDGNSFYTQILEKSSRLRFVSHDRGYNGLYRFEKDGSLEFTDATLFGHKIINMPWKKGEFGAEEGIYFDYVVSEKNSSLVTFKSNISSDISSRSSDSKQEDKIKGNIDIFANNVVSSATIEDKGEYLSVSMIIDVAVANSSSTSINMLKKSTEASSISWSKLEISFDIWEGGLFKSYTVSDSWEGTIKGIKGSATPVDNVYYSYSDKDCSFEKELDFLDAFMLSI